MEPVSGALFNSDISTFYTLLKNREYVHDLVFVQGANSEPGMLNLKSKMLFKRYASVLDKKFLEVETNSNIIFDTLSSMHISKTPLMTTILGLIFNQRFDYFYFPDSNGVKVPGGGRLIELVKPLFGVDGVSMVEHGSDATLDQKIDAVESDALFMEALRTCWENPYRNYNCGRCATCSRNEKARKIVKRLGSDEYEKFASGVEYKSQPATEMRN